MRIREEGLKPHFIKNGGCQGQEHINYLTSQDAIIPVIEKQNWNIANKFAVILMDEVKTEASQFKALSGQDIIRLVLATPKQLCIALLKATGKWKE